MFIWVICSCAWFRPGDRGHLNWVFNLVLSNHLLTYLRRRKIWRRRRNGYENHKNILLLHKKGTSWIHWKRHLLYFEDFFQLSCVFSAGWPVVEEQAEKVLKVDLSRILMITIVMSCDFYLFSEPKRNRELEMCCFDNQFMNDWTSPLFVAGRCEHSWHSASHSTCPRSGGIFLHWRIQATLYCMD